MPGTRRRGRKFRYDPPLPNSQSKFKSPSSDIVDFHYANLLLIERWTWERYCRLALFLRMTEYELASLVMLPHKSIEQYRNNNIMPDRRRANAMLLTIIENHVCGEYTKDTIANPFPKLNGLACTTQES